MIIQQLHFNHELFNIGLDVLSERLPVMCFDNDYHVMSYRLVEDIHLPVLALRYRALKEWSVNVL
jgi:hypothetical protein